MDALASNATSKRGFPELKGLCGLARQTAAAGGALFERGKVVVND